MSKGEAIMSKYIYAFKEPKTKADFILLLDEAINIGKELNNQLDELTRIMKKDNDGF